MEQGFSARCEHQEFAAGFGPATVVDFRSEHDRRGPCGGFFKRRNAIAAVSEGDHRLVDIDAVEAGRHAMIHREADGRAACSEAGVRQSGKRLCQRQIRVRKIQEGLFGGNFPVERRELHLIFPDGLSEIVDAAELKSP